MKVTPKKKYGQHFLRSTSIAQKTADALIDPMDGIIEVGPGMGMLTQFLVQKNVPVWAYEVDAESIEYLQQHFSQYTQLQLIHKDFLTIDFQAYSNNIAVAGNFPYNISTQIIFKVLDNTDKVSQLVGMFQKEVAERICSNHGSKVYGITSVLTQAYYHTSYLFSISNQEFIPPPKVQSGVLYLNRKEVVYPFTKKLLFQIVKAAFNQRRKKLSNSLQQLQIPEAVQSHKFLTLRPEQLSVEDFIELASIWK